LENQQQQNFFPNNFISFWFPRKIKNNPLSMSELLRPEIRLMFFVVGNYNDDKNNKDSLSSIE
jgi:hypothetical protein